MTDALDLLRGVDYKISFLFLSKVVGKKLFSDNLNNIIVFVNPFRGSKVLHKDVLATHFQILHTVYVITK